jgi:hypothetical protein
MEYIKQKLTRLDAAILNHAPPNELHGAVVDLLDYLEAHKEPDRQTELEILRAELVTRRESLPWQKLRWRLPTRPKNLLILMFQGRSLEYF